MGTQYQKQVKHVRTSIIPASVEYHGTSDQLDLEAICIFLALGFFLDRDTFWTSRKTLPVASTCEIDEGGKLWKSQPYFKWHYSPRDISLSQAVEEFGDLFEKVIRQQVNGRQVILPLSGGIDSRTQAVALKALNAEIASYSYSFTGGHDEGSYGKKIATFLGSKHSNWRVPEGYLWDVIDRLAAINGCYAEFTHPRQMAFLHLFSNLGEVFSLGHWGDVLFDDMGVPDDLSFDQQVQAVLKIILKKGGLVLAQAFWDIWGLQGSFLDCLKNRVAILLRSIDIKNSANAQIRAFKSLYWAPRWTSVNLSIFERAKPITLPYYDDRLCEFICTVPENLLAGRQIQIEYIKRRSPALARIRWQEHRPFNLYNYRWDKAPYNLIPRFYGRMSRSVKKKPMVQRNWELQFLGARNDNELQHALFDEPKLAMLIPQEFIQDIYLKFRHEDSLHHSHSISMLLTLSMFCKHFLDASVSNMVIDNLPTDLPLA